MTVPTILTTQDYMRQPAVAADHRLAYGPHPDQFGDLYLPAGSGPHPVVLLIHGGCWLVDYGLEPLGEFCTALAGLGAAVWSIEYRRLGRDGGWPATFLDVAAAADFLRELAPRFRLDLDRVIAAGHSAGGHLALWAAGRRRLPPASPLFAPDPLPIQGVLALAAIPDLVEAVRQAICDDACQQLIGGLPEEKPERYAAGSPHALLPLGVPQRHIAGREDPFVPLAYLQTCTAAAGQVDDVRLDILPEAGHFEVVTRHSAAWPLVRAAALTLLDLAP